MNSVNMIKCFSVVFIGIFIVSNVFGLKAFAKPELLISSSCSSLDPNVIIFGTGFMPDSTVSWKLVDSHENMPLTGYFHTDDKGNINDHTTLDDVGKGTYKIYVGDDPNIDGEFDSKVLSSDVKIPCQNN